jgi:hypothetical protein
MKRTVKTHPQSGEEFNQFCRAIVLLWLGIVGFFAAVFGVGFAIIKYFNL